MSTEYYEFPADDDDWLRAAGIDPKKYPRSITLKEWMEKNPDSTLGFKYVLREEIMHEWGDVKKIYSLEERFEQAGLKIVKEESSQPLFEGTKRTITLSNGMVLQECENEELTKKLIDSDEYYNEENCFVSVNGVERIK